MIIGSKFIIRLIVTDTSIIFQNDDFTGGYTD